MSLADRTIPSPDEIEAYKERFSNWGRWGDDDQFGTLNHITADTRTKAASLVREGRSVSCSRPLATERVLSGSRNGQPVEHRMNVGSNYCYYCNCDIETPPRFTAAHPVEPRTKQCKKCPAPDTRLKGAANQQSGSHEYCYCKSKKLILCLPDKHPR